MAIYIVGMYKNQNKSIHNNQIRTHQYVYLPAIQGEPSKQTKHMQSEISNRHTKNVLWHF